MVTSSSTECPKCGTFYERGDSRSGDDCPYCNGKSGASIALIRDSPWEANSNNVTTEGGFHEEVGPDFFEPGPSRLNIINDPDPNRHKQLLWSSPAFFAWHYDPEQALQHAG